MELLKPRGVAVVAVVLVCLPRVLCCGLVESRADSDCLFLSLALQPTDDGGLGLGLGGLGGDDQSSVISHGDRSKIDMTPKKDKEVCEAFTRLHFGCVCMDRA